MPKQRFIILGEVIKVGKNENMYKIKFTIPLSQVSKSEWFSVKDIADFKIKLKDNKNNLKRIKQQYEKLLLIPLKEKMVWLLFSNKDTAYRLILLVMKIVSSMQ